MLWENSHWESVVYGGFQSKTLHFSLGFCFRSNNTFPLTLPFSFSYVRDFTFLPFSFSDFTLFLFHPACISISGVCVTTQCPVTIMLLLVQAQRVVLALHCTRIQTLYTDLQIHRHKYTNTQIHKYTNTNSETHKYNDAPCRSGTSDLVALGYIALN